MSEPRAKSRRSLKFLWSHELWIHRFLVRIYNQVLAIVPFPVKYGIGARRRRSFPPYALLSPSTTAVQVGSPRDTLLAGRSRGMYFSLLSGRAVVIEPDPASAEEFKGIAAKRGMNGVSVVNSGAWSNESTLRLYVDPAHPATSFTAGTVGKYDPDSPEYDPEALARYQAIDVPVRPIDTILSELGITDLDVLSITTNGGEVEMLTGAAETLERTRYVCVRHGCDEGIAHLEKLGFTFFSHDDRGVTLTRQPA